MQITEFKAWFKGYCENINGTPTREQFDRIKEEVDNIQPYWYFNPGTFRVTDPIVITKNDYSVADNILRREYQSKEI